MYRLHLFSFFSRNLLAKWIFSPKNLICFCLDDLKLFSPKVRGMEAQGVPTKQAEAITAAITEVLHDSLENISHSFVSKPEMQKVTSSTFVSFYSFFCFNSC